MDVKSIGCIQPFVAASEIKIENKTTAKVADLAKNLFKKVLFWCAVIVGLVFSVSILKSAVANPITAIALSVLGIWCYKNKQKISSFVKMHVSALKEKLGISKQEIYCKVTDNILLGQMPTHGKDYFKALKEAKVKTVISIMHQDQSLYSTWISKPILPHEFIKQEINYIPIKIKKPKELSIEEMNTIADLIFERAQDQQSVYVHGELDSSIDQIGLLSYMIKYTKKSLEMAQLELTAIKPDLEISDESLGRLYKFALGLKES